MLLPPHSKNLIIFPGKYHQSCENGTHIGRVLQTRSIVPSPQIVVDDFLKGWCLDELCPVSIACEFHDLEYIQIAYPASV